ncbi:serine/threonine protein kinase [Streptomyces lincolnensis]|uniref:serine/threonine protein kinase n=1 Tax=Streptomyces lincolnensis TaxID=1915 RepID=UPI001E6453EE|nr:serine/threonine protein kinase [Streptomyces lincolnensis]MCD7443985.1 serine/threonine protein kinase [Streptomyces lincolnensis]
MHATGAANGRAQSGAAASRRIGPYVLITALDTPHTHIPVPERRYIARSEDGEHTVLLSVPLRGTAPHRFMAEASASRYLLGPFAAPAVACAAPGEAAWHARPYQPALPLPTALAVNGGPLSERTVCALGAALAETLAVVHAQGLVFAGVSPAAVLLTADGPRLSCFGAVRTAAPDGTPRSGLPGLEPGSLPPEQAAGGHPRPLGDVYALGATLAYAATGHTTPESEELPSGIRVVVGRCLSRDPANRPQVAELLNTFAADDQEPTGSGSEARSAALLRPGWLPNRVIAAIAHQSAALLATDIQRSAVTPTPAFRQN